MTLNQQKVLSYLNYSFHLNNTKEFKEMKKTLKSLNETIKYVFNNLTYRIEILDNSIKNKTKNNFVKSEESTDDSKDGDDDDDCKHVRSQCNITSISSIFTIKLEYENKLKNLTSIYEERLSLLNQTFHLNNEKQIQKLNDLENENKIIAKMNSNLHNYVATLQSQCRN